MSIAGKELADFAQGLWKNFFSGKVRDTQKNMVRYYRAEVTGAAQDGKITIRRPFDAVEISVPCARAMDGAEIGKQVVVLVYGEEKNLANHMVMMYTDGGSAALYPNG